MSKRRAPVIVVKSDDLVIESGGEKYHPHEGEEVSFRKRISPRDMMVVAKATKLQEGDDEGKMARFYYDDVCPILARAIIRWDWTDPYTGEELDNPPSADTLRELDAFTELQYLLEKWLEGTAPEALPEEGN